MKYEQIDVALSFLGVCNTIIIQYEFRRDGGMIMQYILNRIDPDRTITVYYGNIIEILGGARIILLHVDSVQNGYDNAIPFFIERLCDDYSEGDIIGGNTHADIRSHDISTVEYQVPTHGHTSTSTSISKNDYNIEPTMGMDRGLNKGNLESDTTNERRVKKHD